MSTYYELIFEGKFTEADEMRRKTIPQKLYKFMGLKTELSDAVNLSKLNALENNELGFASIETFNDPYEFRAFYIDKQRIIDAGWEKDIVEKIGEALDFKQMSYVSCLTANDENILPMWAYYTDNYQGICIEYSVEKPEIIHPVSYEASRVGMAVIPTNLFDAIMKRDAKKIELYLRIFKESLFVKHESWGWEKEYRLIYPRDSVAERKAVPLSTIGLKTTKIIAGIKCSDEVKARLKDIASKIGAEYKQAKLSDTGFGFEQE